MVAKTLANTNYLFQLLNQITNEKTMNETLKCSRRIGQKTKDEKYQHKSINLLYTATVGILAYNSVFVRLLQKPFKTVLLRAQRVDALFQVRAVRLGALEPSAGRRQFASFSLHLILQLGKSEHTHNLR